MKKNVILIIIIMLCLNLVGCRNMFNNGYQKSKEIENEYAERITKNIITAINSSDSENFYKQLSPILRSDRTVETNCKKLFNVFLNKKIINYTVKVYNARENIEKNNYYHSVSFDCRLECDNDEKYIFFIESFIDYEADKKKEGCYRFSFDTYLNYEKDTDDYFLSHLPETGVYYPGWENDQE